MSCPKCGDKYVWQPPALEPYWSLDTDPHTRIKFCPFCGWNLAKDVAKDVVPLALTPADNEYLAQRKRAQEEAIAAFGVPPSVMDDVHLRREKPRHISDNMVFAGPPLKWTRSMPTEPGIYWMHADGLTPFMRLIEVLHVVWGSGYEGLAVMVVDSGQTEQAWPLGRLSEIDRCWYGPLPIEKPEPPKEEG